MNLNPPALPNLNLDVLVNVPGSQFSPAWYSYFNGERAALLNFAPVSVEDTGGRPDGSDATGAFQSAINRVISQGGGVVVVPAGVWSINSIFTPRGAPPVAIVGQSMGSTFLQRRSSLPNGQGLIDVSSSFFSMSDLTIDGMQLTPQRLQYGVDFNGINGNDPYAASLTRNTSVWVRGNTRNHSFMRVRFTHTSGYSAMLDATAGDIDDPSFIQCFLEDIRASLFGTNPADLNYGSWNGGLFAKGDGRTAGSGVVGGLLVALCSFKRITGNACWSHLWGLNNLHEDFRLLGNYFEDCGLDGIEIGGVTSGVVQANVFRRIGYISLADGVIGTPRWLPGLNATALDSAGLVINVSYTNNTFLNTNGGNLDLDSHGQSTVSGNVVRVSLPGDPEYIIDQVAISGPTNSGSGGYGLNLNNSSNTALGAANIDITGNQFINLQNGAIRLFAGRDCLVEANSIISPDAPGSAPISLGPVGLGPNQRATRNRISGNAFYYNPAGAEPCVKEDNGIAPFVGTDKNYVFSNNPLFPDGTAAFEFSPDGSSSSPTFASTIWFP